ncbi:MAG: hypothetical protein IH591_04165 [Bacteroidales bacterium]|nr:hypothetical protein [Bacteroidales bacterium]
MKKSLFNTLLLTIAIIIFGAATASSQEITKDFKKSFTVSPQKAVIIDNRYGDVFIESTDGKEVTIDVRVTVEMSSTERSEKLITLIDVQFMENDSAVGAKTVLDDRFSTVTRGAGNNRFSIDYTVRMPAENYIDISNRYGNVKLADHRGRININLRYGNLVALKLSRGNVKPINTIAISYGKATIEEANWLSVVSRYTTDFSIGKVQAMTLDSRYSKIIIDEAGSIVADSKYDNISVLDINNLVAESGYTTYKLGTLHTNLKVEARYGSMTTDRVPPGFETIDIDASYFSTTIAIDRSASYRLDARLNYGSLSYCEECVDITRKIVETTSREIAGVAGTDKNTTATVKINSSYSSVRLR